MFHTQWSFPVNLKLFSLIVPKYLLQLDRLQWYFTSFTFSKISLQVKFLPLCTQRNQIGYQRDCIFAREKNTALDVCLKVRYFFSHKISKGPLQKIKKSRKDLSVKQVRSSAGIFLSILHPICKRCMSSFNSTYFFQVLWESFFFSICSVKKPTKIAFQLNRSYLLPAGITEHVIKQYEQANTVHSSSTYAIWYTQEHWKKV